MSAEKDVRLRLASRSSRFASAAGIETVRRTAFMVYEYEPRGMIGQPLAFVIRLEHGSDCAGSLRRSCRPSTRSWSAGAPRQHEDGPRPPGIVIAKRARRS